MVKLDLGCGLICEPGHIGVDWDGKPPVLKMDIRKLELPDKYADHVRCSHALEHIPGHDWRCVVSEIARVLKLGGTFEIKVPHPSHDCAMIQGHVHVFNPEWWRQWQRDNWFPMLVIDSVEEVHSREWLEFKEKPPEAYWKFLRNVYFETRVLGHKPNAR